MQLGISEILERASKIETRAARVAYLRKESSHSLSIVLQYALDPNIKWAVGPELPPFTRERVGGQELMLLAEARRLYLFIEDGNPDLTDHRREVLFVQLLEMLSADDIKLMEAIINKRLPYPNLEYDVIKEAFPDLLPDITFQAQTKQIGETVQPEEFTVTEETIEKVLEGEIVLAPSSVPKNENIKKSPKAKRTKKVTAP